MLINESIGYSEKLDVLGAIVSVNLLDESVILMDEDENTYETHIDDVIELKEIGELEDVYIYQHDVLMSVNSGRLFEIDTNEDGNAVLHVLDNLFNRTGKSGEPFKPADIRLLEKELKFVGNVLRLRKQKPTLDFNIALFRKVEDGVCYFVANIKEEEKVDIFKTAFFDVFVEEVDELYQRVTMSHDDFLVEIANGVYEKIEFEDFAEPIDECCCCEECCEGVCRHDVVTEEVEGTMPNPFELFVDKSDTMYVKDDSNTKITISNREVEKKIENICQKCNEPDNECDCNLWGRR